jgi:hypothetical protein
MPRYIWQTRTAKGEHEAHSRSQDGFFRGRGARSQAPTKAKSKELKLKDECWSVLSIRNWFLKNEIHADKTDWFITFNKPNRKMTAADQLELMLQPDNVDHLVTVNYRRKHLIINTLEINPEEQ